MRAALRVRWLAALLSAILALQIEARCQAEDAPAAPNLKALLPDHRTLNFRCLGAGSPTVLFESGFAASSLAWTRVQALVAPRYRACAYDRAGYGWSDPGPMPRDGATVARDLDDGLRSAGIGGPFIVVGHSAGGLYVRLFADRRPREVVGMVLVDPSVEHQDVRLAAAFGPGAGSLSAQRTRAELCLEAARRGQLPSKDPILTRCAPPARPGQPASLTATRLLAARKPSTWETQISELDTLWRQTSDEVAAGRRDYGAMPLIVLTAAGTFDEAPQSARPNLLQFWTKLHGEIAARSTRGQERLVGRSSHLMMIDRPDAIAGAIDEVAIASRRIKSNRRPDEKRR